MAFTEQTMTRQTAELDRELEQFQQMVSAARRNRWHGGDVLGREFDQFLASLPVGRPAAASEAPTARRNAWRAVLDQLG